MIEESGIDCKGKKYQRIELGKAEDLSKRKFNRLLPLFRVKDANRTVWLCQCDCGNLIKVRGSHITTEKIKSCGCLQREISAGRYIDLTGQKFGELTALERVLLPNLNEKGWRCLCSCGKESFVRTDNLTSGTSKTCGHSKTDIKDLSGKQFGYWTVLEMAPRTEQHIYWICRCKCGTVKKVRGDGLTSNKSRSCGCKNVSYGADLIEKLLIENNVIFQKEYCFPDLLSPIGKPLRFDFAILNNGEIAYLIEFDGELHYQARIDFDGEAGLQYRQKCDDIKNRFCQNNNLSLIRFPFYEINNLSYENLFSNKYLISPSTEQKE